MPRQSDAWRCLERSVAFLLLTCLSSSCTDDSVQPQRAERFQGDGSVLDAITGEPLVGTVAQFEGYSRVCGIDIIFGGGGCSYEWDVLASDEADPAGQFVIDSAPSGQATDYRMCFLNRDRFQLEGVGSGYGFLKYSSRCEEPQQHAEIHLQPHGVLRIRFGDIVLNAGEEIVVQEPVYFVDGGESTNLTTCRLPLPEHHDMEIEAGVPFELHWTVKRSSGDVPGSAVVVGERFAIKELILPN